MDRPTIEVYERHAEEWQQRRAPRDRFLAGGLRRRADASGTARPLADLGCGPGWYTSELGAGALALDAARSMLELAAVHAPQALRVQADLEALPLRPGGLGGAWARSSYVHVPRARVPLALADLHRSLAPGAHAELHLFGGDQEVGALAGDDFPGRAFSLWPERLLADVVVGAGFELDELEVRDEAHGPARLVVRARRARTLPDIVGPGMRLLVCGLNPSLYAADAGVGYARPGNRFWPAALGAGLASRARDAHHALTRHGLGMTDLVKRATVAAGELGAEEYRDGLARVTRLCEWLRPRAVCFVGLAGWRAAVDRHARPGPQARRIGGCATYLMPSTSGLNASTQLAAHVAHLRAAARLADAA